MWLNELRQRWLGRFDVRRAQWQPPRRRSPVRLTVRPLEARLTPTTYNAATVSDLINDINAINANVNTKQANNTINLTAPGGLYVLTAPYLTTADGLPPINPQLAGKLTINGNEATIERSSTSAFRLLEIDSNGNVTINSLTLQYGLATGSGNAAEGGAIYNQGILTLRTRRCSLTRRWAAAPRLPAIRARMRKAGPSTAVVGH